MQLLYRNFDYSIPDIVELFTSAHKCNQKPRLTRIYYLCMSFLILIYQKTLFRVDSEEVAEEHYSLFLT